MLLWDYWPGPEGGAERQCRNLVRELEKRNIECLVITSWSHFGFKKSSFDGSSFVKRYGIFCPIATFCKSNFYRISKILDGKYDSLVRVAAFWLLLPIEWIARFSFVLELSLFFRENREDVCVIHVHETSWLAGVGVNLAKLWKVPVVCKVRNTPALDVIGYDTPLRKRWERLRRDASFIALHSDLSDELLAVGIPSKNIAIIPNGVDIVNFDAGQNNALEVVYVGNFYQGVEHKGFDILLKAWAIVYTNMPGAHLTMVGGGDKVAWVRMAEELGCSCSVSFIGSVQDPGPFYRQASIFVLPSRHEGMSNALLEAQSFGLPAVVSDIPGNRAVVEDRVTGIIVPIGDTEALATAILELLMDTVKCCRMGLAARERVEKMFSRKFVTDQLVTLYENLKRHEGDISP